MWLQGLPGKLQMSPSDVASVFELLHHLFPAAPRSPGTGLRRPPPLKAGRCPRWSLPPPPRHPPGRRRRRLRRPPAPRPDPNVPRRLPESSLRRWQQSVWRKTWTYSTAPARRRRRVSVRVLRRRPLTLLCLYNVELIIVVLNSVYLCLL